MAKKATSKTAPVVKTAPKTVVRFKLTGREYRPKAVQNRASWATISAMLAKGPATEEQLLKALTYGDKYLKAQDKEVAEKWPAKYKEAHTDFLGYMMKGKDSSKHYIERV